MANPTALLKTPYNVLETTVPWRVLVNPLPIERFLNPTTMQKSFWNKCAYGPTQAGVVQAVYRKQPALLNKSTVNAPNAIQWVVDQLPIKEGASVLDLNTGTGVVARALSKKGAKVVGNDISRHMIDFASAIPGDVKYILANSNKLPLEDNSFDVVISRLAFNHIEDPRAVFAEIARVLKPGGFVGIVERTFPEDIYQERFEERFNELERARDPSHLTFWREQDLKSTLEAFNVKVNVSSTTEVHETLSSYLNLTNTLPPNREYITQWLSGNTATSDPDFNQVTGFKPARTDGDEMLLTHTHQFVGGVLSKQ